MKEKKSKEKIKDKAKDKKVKIKPKSSKKKNIPRAIVYVNCSYNNTMISFTDLSGNLFAQSSSGCVGIHGSKKGTAYAATKSAIDAYEKASKYGVVEAICVIKGVGMGRKAALKGLRSSGLIITSLSDRTPVAHNGCRPRKKPRGS